MRRHLTRHAVSVVAMIAVGMLAVLLSVGPAAAQATTLPADPPTTLPADPPTTLPADPPTTLPVAADDGAGGIIPKPNSGVAPQQPGDRGGWMQTLLFGLVLAGMATVVGVIARGTAMRTRAMQAQLTAEEADRPAAP